MCDEVEVFKHAFCPECGPVINSDEDSRCLTCGAEIIVGTAFDELMEAKKKAETALCRARVTLDSVGRAISDKCSNEDLQRYALPDIESALSSSASYSHESKIARLRGVMEEAIENCPCKRENITPGCCRCETFRAALVSL